MSSSLESLWYQIFQVAFLFLEMFSDRSEPHFSSRKGNWCPVIAQKSHKCCPKSTSSGEEPAKAGWAVTEQFMNLLLACFFLSRLGKEFGVTSWWALGAPCSSAQWGGAGGGGAGIHGCVGPWMGLDIEVVSKFRVPFWKQSLAFLCREVGWIVIVGSLLKEPFLINSPHNNEVPPEEELLWDISITGLFSRGCHR